MSEYIVLLKSDKNDIQPLLNIEANNVKVNQEKNNIKFFNDLFDTVAAFNLNEIKGFYKVRGVLDV